MLINIWVGCKTVNIKARKSLYVYDANFIITIKKTYNTVWHTLQTLINFIIDFSDLEKQAKYMMLSKREGVRGS